MAKQFTYAGQTFEVVAQPLTKDINRYLIKRVKAGWSPEQVTEWLDERNLRICKRTVKNFMIAYLYGSGSKTLDNVLNNLQRCALTGRIPKPFDFTMFDKQFKHNKIIPELSPRADHFIFDYSEIEARIFFHVANKGKYGSL